jgi:adenine phosphoribosyltransferase
LEKQENPPTPLSASVGIPVSVYHPAIRNEPLYLPSYPFEFYGRLARRFFLLTSLEGKNMLPTRETYSIEIAGLRRELPLFEVKPGLRIAVLNILGDVELVQACATVLAEKIRHVEFDILVTAEAKSIPLVHALAVEMRVPYVVLRKAYKPYMGEALEVETHSITTGQLQKLYLDEKDRGLISGKNIVILDDVISTGSTLNGMRDLMKQAGANILAEAAILTEGEQSDWKEILSLGHLPLFDGVA